MEAACPRCHHHRLPPFILPMRLAKFSTVSDCLHARLLLLLPNTKIASCPNGCNPTVPPDPCASSQGVSDRQSLTDGLKPPRVPPVRFRGTSGLLSGAAAAPARPNSARTRTFIFPTFPYSHLPNCGQSAGLFLKMKYRLQKSSTGYLLPNLSEYENQPCT